MSALLKPDNCKGFLDIIMYNFFKWHHKIITCTCSILHLIIVGEPL